MSKVVYVRLWLLSLATLGMMFVWPTAGLTMLSGWSIAPLGFMFCPHCCPCPGCTGSVPGQVQVDVAGVTNGVCNNCTAFNGTWVLTRTTTDCPSGSDVGTTLCLWAYTAATPSICANLGVPSGICVKTYTEGLNLWGALFWTGGGASAVTYTDPTDEYACGDFDEHSIPFALQPGGCVGSSSTFKVTAL